MGLNPEPGSEPRGEPGGRGMCDMLLVVMQEDFLVACAVTLVHNTGDMSSYVCNGPIFPLGVELLKHVCHCLEYLVRSLLHSLCQLLMSQKSKVCLHTPFP